MVADKFQPIRSLHFTTRPAKHLLHVLLRAKHLQLKSNAPSYYPCGHGNQEQQPPHLLTTSEAETAWKQKRLW